MKKLVLINLIFLAVGAACYAMEDFGGGKKEKEEFEEQEERTSTEQVPTLKELAAKQVAKLGAEDLPTQFPLEVKELVMQQSSLHDIMNFITAHAQMTSEGKTESPLLRALQESKEQKQEYIGKEVLKKVPLLLFDALLNSQIQFSDFMQWIANLPTEIRQSITAVFADYIHKYMTRDTINFIGFTINDYNKWGQFLSRHGGEDHLPIEFEEVVDINKGITILQPFLPVKIGTQQRAQIINPYSAILSPEYLVPVFIIQQLELLLLDTLKDHEENFRNLINKGTFIYTQLHKEINIVLSQLKQYITSHEDPAIKIGVEYPVLKIYFDKLNDLFSKLSSNEAIIGGLSYSTFVWNEKEQAHVKK